jgi:hypothetical protein
MGDLEAMTVDYVSIVLAVKRGNPSVIWRSGQERQPWPSKI